jgi:hypothetical protein
MDEQNDRHFPRYYAVNPDADLTLSQKDGGTVLDGKVVDVSRDGIGFLGNERLIPGTRVILKIDKIKIEFSIVYCTQDIINPDAFRVGLNRQLSTENLVTLFQSHSLIQEKPDNS